MFDLINRVDEVMWPPKRDSSADISSVSPTSERIQRANAENVST